MFLRQPEKVKSLISHFASKRLLNVERLSNLAPATDDNSPPPRSMSAFHTDRVSLSSLNWRGRLAAHRTRGRCCAQFHPGATLQGRGPLHHVHHEIGEFGRAKPFEIDFVQCFLGHRGPSVSGPRNRIRKMLGMTECRHRAVSLISLNICCATRQTLTWR